MAGNSKNVLLPFKIISAGDMSASSITSAVTNIRYMDNIAISIIFTGSPVGTFEVQGSVDYNIGAPGTGITNAGTWVPLTLSTSPIASGAAGQILLDLNQLSFGAIRVVYTKTSGTGALNVWISGKSV